MKRISRLKGKEWKFMFDIINDFREFAKTAALADSPITVYEGIMFLRPIRPENDMKGRIMHTLLLYDGPGELPKDANQIGINSKTGDIVPTNGAYDTDLDYLEIYRYDYSDYYEEIVRQYRKRFKEIKNQHATRWEIFTSKKVKK